MKVYREWNVDGLIARGYEEKISEEVVVFFHGFTGNKTESNRLFYHLSTYLERQGISTIRFDWFGHGESDLAFHDITTNLLEREADVILDYAFDNYEKVNLLGFSMGGAFAMNKSNSKLEKLILLAPAYKMAEFKDDIFSGTLDQTRDLGGIILSRTFLDGFKKMPMLDRVVSFTHPILIIQGGKDQSVPQELSIALHEKLGNSKLELFPDSDHCFHNHDIHRVIGNLIISFIHMEVD